MYRKIILGDILVFMIFIITFIFLRNSISMPGSLILLSIAIFTRRIINFYFPLWSPRNVSSPLEYLLLIIVLILVLRLIENFNFGPTIILTLLFTSYELSRIVIYIFNKRKEQ